MTRRRNRVLGLTFIICVCALVAGTSSCSSDKPIDQNYGKEAGTDFEAPPSDRHGDSTADGAGGTAGQGGGGGSGGAGGEAGAGGGGGGAGAGGSSADAATDA